MKIHLLIVCLLCGVFVVKAQDLGSLKDAKPFTLSGPLSMRLNSYSTTRTNSQRTPFFWTLTGSPTVSIYGVALPFYFSFSQKNQNYRQPFNQFGVSPYYKWLKIHLGYRNISFSDFTLSNHTFRGVGIEAEPSIFRFGFVYGRFLKAINQPLDTIAGQIIQPTFARKGIAAKVGIGTYNNYVDLIFFKGKDDSTSVTAPLSMATTRPAENLVYGIKARQAFLKVFYFDLDYGFSIYTSDITAGEVNTGEYKVPSLVAAFLTPRTSTQFLMAGKASLSMRIKILMLRLQYTRVEPDYQSMGSYFLNNDYENITISPSWSMFRSKVRIMGSVGFQRNNLFEDKISNTVRRINSTNISYAPNQKFNISAFYTNYQINQERNIRLTLDTLKLQQFSHNLNVNPVINFGTKELRQTLTGGFNYQLFINETNLGQGINQTSSVNPMIGYRFQNKNAGLGINATINVNEFTADTTKTVRWSYSAGANKNLKDDGLNLGGTLTYYKINVNGASQSTAVSLNGRASYSVKERHNFNLGFSLISRKEATGEKKSIQDVLGNFGYTYNIGNH